MNKKITVMIIDDNKLDLFVHIELIELMEIAHTVLDYQIAIDALNYLKENDSSQWPDIILLDIYMPVMNGFDFLNHYALLPESSRQKCNIIIVSSTLDPGDKIIATKNSHVLEFLDKPLNTEKLAVLLETQNIIKKN